MKIYFSNKENQVPTHISENKNSLAHITRI